jgi:hypothetical protein
MQELSHFGITNELQLSALIADLWWRVDLMNSDILEEESKAGVFDTCQPTYPMLARNLRARRDNLVSTINVLQERVRLTKSGGLAALADGSRPHSAIEHPDKLPV